jgi:prophage regulatory protein
MLMLLATPCHRGQTPTDMRNTHLIRGAPMTNSALALAADHPSICLQRLPEVQAALAGLSRANIYARVARGLLPRPVKIGKAITWPSNEIATIVAAHVKGASESEIVALVQSLHENRTGN